MMNFVAVEGPDCCGKTSVLAYLRDMLTARWPHGPVEAVRDPGTTPLGAAMRTSILLNPDLHVSAFCQALLFSAVSRALLDHCVERPKTLYLSDRCYLSLLAYQGAQGVTFAFLWRVAEVARTILDRRHLFVLEVDEEVRRKRFEERHAKDRDRMEAKGWEFQVKVREAYDSAIRRKLATPIDANREPQAIAGDIADQVEDLWRG
jgi:dTMP kinase